MVHQGEALPVTQVTAITKAIMVKKVNQNYSKTLGESPSFAGKWVEEVTRLL